ncbi:hypothetical protein CABS01_00532 [Colletotrichum abscissum]|uniref:uncharacterized protein n=1 Tax=Colletotrichum abscissum TaxID=1671311 RepID=UPI0027D5AF96|nr:uncharacterized protein CABS01_00532 [Colletotrichum abscissum]KAK1525443.1 hypothetical protein CABS01_00532 [Colletotrichum abscissum]
MSIAIRLWSLALALAALPCACPSPVSPPFYTSILITIILGALGVPFSCNIIHIRMHEYTRIGRLEAKQSAGWPGSDQGKRVENGHRILAPVGPACSVSDVRKQRQKIAN